jgi:hypothetical protein
MSKSKFQPSKNFLPTTFGKEPSCLAFAEICNNCETKAEYKTYVNNIHKFTKYINSIKFTEFGNILAERLLNDFIVSDNNRPIATHYNNIIKTRFRKIILNKKLPK